MVSQCHFLPLRTKTYCCFTLESQTAINHLLSSATFQLRLATYALLIIKSQNVTHRAATKVPSGEHTLLPCYQGGRSFGTRSDTCQIGTGF